MSHSTHRKTIINSKTYSILVDHLFFYEIMKLVFTVEVPKESFLYLNLREQCPQRQNQYFLLIP